MSEDPIVVTTRTSWFSRLGAAFGGILTGLGLVLAGIILLAWNEGRSVQSIRTNNEGVRAVASVSATRVDPVHEGRLIHVTAPASATGRLRDADLCIRSGHLIVGLHNIRPPGQQVGRQSRRNIPRQVLLHQ